MAGSRPERSASASPGPSRRGAYPSDLSDAQWAVIEPLLLPRHRWSRGEAPSPRDRCDLVLGPRRVCLAAAAHVLPTLGDRLLALVPLAVHGTLDRVHDALRDRLRDASGRDPMVSAGDPRLPVAARRRHRRAGQRGYHAGKRVNGTKRHVVVDTLGLLLVVMVTAANVQRQTPTGSTSQGGQPGGLGLCSRWSKRKACGMV